eukprot:3149653-Prorocentrum_lima.AAC.1
MTSSLVGSEMCIRDSTRAQFDLIRQAMMTKKGKSKLSLTKAWWMKNVAVSYTHLTLPTICSV